MFALHAIASIAIAILASGPGTDPYPNPLEPIWVISASQEVTFPSQVLLSLVAEADAEIVEITLYYKLGGREIVTYGYPEFSPSRRVSAEYAIGTDGPRYLPSGVEIEYYYVIEDVTGNTLETERFRFVYMDPRYDWRELSLGSLTIAWHDLPEERVAAVASDVNRRLEDVMDLMGLETSPPMKAVILTRGSASQSFPFISEAASRGHIFGGFAFGDYDLFLLIGLHYNGMVHEFTHLLLDEAVDSPLARVPAWVNEGLAMYFESGSDEPSLTVMRALDDGRLLRLGSMNSVPGRPRDVGLFYAQARSIVGYMVGAYGRESMAGLLQALDGGQDIDEAIATSYGKSLEGLEAEWKAWLSGDPIPVEAETAPVESAPDLEPDSGSEPEPARVPDPSSSMMMVVVGSAGTAGAILVFAFATLRLRRRTDEPD